MKREKRENIVFLQFLQSSLKITVIILRRTKQEEQKKARRRREGEEEGVENEKGE